MTTTNDETRTYARLSPAKAMKAALVVASLAIASFANTLPNASALNALSKFDAQGDSPYADFDIKSHFIDSDGSLNVQLYGLAGRTLPEGMHDAYAYVVVTDNGIYAADSHEAQHADDEQVANKAWHGHKVVVDENGCLTEIGSFKSQAKLAGSNVKITATGATKIVASMTVMIEILVDDPDNPPPGTTCIARVAQVFDEAVLLR
jgi:hypothetical protein